MTSVVLQPTGGRANYVSTVEQPVKFEDYAHLIPQATLHELRRSFPSGEAAMWGVTRGKEEGPNRREYGKIRVGDTVMFHDKSRFFAAATVACLFHNPGLAEQLPWDPDPEGQIYEYMYAVDEVRPLDLSHADFNPIVGYKGMPRNVTVMNAARSQALFEHLPLESRRFTPPTSEEDYENALAGLNGDLDVEAVTRRRTEQDYLRRLLFPGVEACCHLCGHYFEVQFLVAAHIKKRAACSDTEKRDARHIVIAACRFGCDELFERGYITVAADGAIVLSPALRGQALEYATQHLADKTLEAAMPGREDYFAWHRERSYRN